MPEDANIEPENQQAAGSSASGQNPSPPEDEVEGDVPFHEHPRWKEVYQENQDFQQQVEDLNEENKILRDTLGEANDTEPTDWKEAEERLTAKAVEKMENTMNEQKAEEEMIEQGLDKDFENLRALGHNIDDDEETNVLEYMIKNEKEDVIEAYKDYQEEAQEAGRVSQQKGEAQIPSSAGVEPNVPAFDYQEIRGKSLDELVDEAASE